MKTGTDRGEARSRMARTAGVAALAAAVAAGLLAMTQGFTRPVTQPQADRLSDTLSRTIETRGIDAAVEQYRSLREQGFPGPHESESDTNRLGYRLLGKDDTASAIRIFQLNAETHPDSANVHDSLGEAYLATGNKPLAIESYKKVLALNPRSKGAAAELQRLAHIKRKPYPLIVLFHIAGGALGILSGASSLALRKGSRRHAVAGRVFVVSMLGMSASGAYRAFVTPDQDAINVLMGVLTFYLVATSWLTARRRKGGTGPADWAALLVAVAAGIGLVRLALAGGAFAVVAAVFAAIAFLSAAGDLRMIARGGVYGSPRIVRHLWRMGTALYIAVASFFLGQQQVFPYAVRRSGLLFAPVGLLVVTVIYWLVRVRFTGAYKTPASPKTSLVMGPPSWEGTQA